MAAIQVSQRDSRTRTDSRVVRSDQKSKEGRQELNMEYFGRQIGISSFVSGFTMILTHPLDTVRVRMQMSSSKSSVYRIFGETYRGEGVRGFYKGMLSPVLGATPYNATIFTVCKAIKSQLDDDMDDEVKSLVSGATAGGLTLFVFCPIGLLKVRAQVNREGSIRYRHAISNVLREEGFRGFYRGFAPQLAAGVMGWGAYFFNYDFLQRMFGVQKNQAQSTPDQTLRKMLAGGLAGLSSWAVVYPLDNIKTKVQGGLTQVSSREMARQVYRRMGVRGFYGGLSATVMRSFSINSIRLPLFDYLNDLCCEGDSLAASD